MNPHGNTTSPTDRAVLAGGLAALALLASPAGAVTLVNGSLTGTPGANSVPSGWFAQLGFPATSSVSSNFGQPAATFATTASASPDGGSWVSLFLRSSPASRSQIAQAVTGMTPGWTYRVSWYTANFGYRDGFSSPLVDSAQIQMLVGGTSVGFGQSVPVQPGWVAESLSFTATAATMVLTFGTRATTSPNASVLSIDGISISAVPEPASVWMMLGGGVGLGVLARRRRASGARA